MVTFTEKARAQVLAFMREQGLDNQAVRVAVRGSPLVPEYDLALVDASDRSPDDVVVDAGGFEVFIDPGSAKLLEGATIDWVQTLQEAGFRIDNPNVKPLGAEPPSGPLAERVRRVIDTRINPAVATHGGHVSLVDLRDNIVYVQLRGGCQGCGMAAVTLRQGIEAMLRDAVPEIAAVVDVTDHAAGRNPYYPSAT
jgi:Fe/S biogenesis protein NfuA